jgi:hypothetical protein
VRPYLEKKKKTFAKKVDGVVPGIGPEFKSKYNQKNQREINKYIS